MREVQGLPELVVSLGRRRLPTAVTAAVVSVRVRGALAQPAQCELTLVDDPAVGPVDPGEALRVEIAGRRPPLFAGEVTVIGHSYRADGTQLLRLRAYDALHRLRKRQFSRLHDARDLGALARTLCAGTGLQVRGGTEPVGPVYQWGQTDLALLVHRCARAGRFPVVDGTDLWLVALAGEGEPVDLDLGQNLHSAELEVSQEPAYRSSEVTGWDPLPASGVRGRADADRARARVRADPAPSSVGGGGTLLRTDEPLSDGSGADALAQAELDVRAAGEVTAELVVEGDPRLRPGRTVRLRGVSAALEGVYTVCTAEHTIDATGYETVLSTRPPEPPAARACDVSTLGTVVDTDDPEGRGRVRVALPAHADLVTAWCPVLVAGAGHDKGAVILPAVGDEVLTLLLGGDPHHAVVLGGMYGRDGPPDAGAPGPRGGRYTVRTGDGQQVVLDGAEHRLALEDGHGSTVELGPDLVRISAGTDLLLEAPGRALRIRARSVDFEEAP